MNHCECFFYFRAHMNFVQDCLDAFILTAAMEIFGIGKLNEDPKKSKPPHFLHLASKEDQYKWLCNLGKQLLDEYVKLDNGKNVLVPGVGASGKDPDNLLQN